MNKSHLRACPACARHVRVAEQACPFCGGALSSSFRAAAPPQPPRVRLTRAALFAFGTGALGTGTMALAPGCSSSTNPIVSDDSGPGAFDAAYGGPPVDSGPGVSLDAAYGAPPFDGHWPDVNVNSGDDASADGGSDAAEDAPDFVFDAAYGAPPFD